MACQPTRSPQAAPFRQPIEERSPGTEQHRVDDEPIPVDRAEPRKRLHDAAAAAAVDHHVAAGLVFQPRDFVGEQ
jgi:hypothetical protein